MQYWLKRSGFSEVELNFINPFSEKDQLETVTNSKPVSNNFDKLNDLIFGARDCAIIAKK